MKWSSKKIPISAITFILTLIILLLAALYLKNKVESDSMNPFILQLTENSNDSQDVQVSVTVDKSWINNEGLETETIGAQYNGEITNGYANNLENWQLILPMSEKGTLDSSWNGTYSLEESRMVLIPDDNTKVILPGESKTFGFIMISDELLDFNEFELIGYRQTTYVQYPLFWILIALAAIWAIAFFTYISTAISTAIRMRHFVQRRENDDKIISQTMRTFADLIDAKDPYTKGHSLRVSVYASEIGRRMGLSDDDIRILGYIALMHDCGKIGVPDNILTKPAKLDTNERQILEEHTTRGGMILKNFTAIDGIRDGALYHHERFDGSGYPKGLKGSEIPLCARIICVADAYDAMSSDRCYRKHLSVDKIIQELNTGSGAQFDPEPVKHILDMMADGFCDRERNIITPFSEKCC